MNSIFQSQHHHLSGGMRIFVVPVPCPKQIKFPRSKKRRIRNKWMKDGSNWAAFSEFIEDGVVMGTPKGLHMNQGTYNELKREIHNSIGSQYVDFALDLLTVEE